MGKDKILKKLEHALKVSEKSYHSETDKEKKAYYDGAISYLKYAIRLLD